MNASDFSWYKIASIFGAGLLVLIACSIVAGGIYLIQDGRAFNGVTCFVGAFLCGVGAWAVYTTYQRKSEEGKPGVKSK